MKVRAVVAIGVLSALWAAAYGALAQEPSMSGLQGDPQASLRFSGTPSAELFSREIEASFDGVLEKDFVSSAADGEPAGFVNASPKGQPWAGTMWTRDSGTYLRELTMRGYYAHASLLADCLMNLVDKNADGFYSYPRFFRGAQHGTGSELDGTSAIVIGMVLLWERLPEGNVTKERIEHFLLQEASPLQYFKHRLQAEPLLAGTGEFGCGMRIAGECDNVVQNNLVRLALLAGADMAGALGRSQQAEEDRQLAAKISGNMEKYLVGSDGAWIWAIDSATLKADPRVLDAKVNRGFGGTNGVAAMDADVLGLQPLAAEAAAMQHSKKTFLQLYITPLRKQEFDRYGIWTQFDDIAAGMLTSPSYGQGYALQTMLLSDDLAMAGKAMDFLANATYRPIPEYPLQRSSPYYFYERYYSPDAVGKTELAAGCGALNLVNVTEPLKVSRLMLGVDDSSTAVVSMLPRLPANWISMEARDWPIRTEHGVVRANITFTKVGTGATLDVQVVKGERIGKLRVRLPSAHGYVWREQRLVSAARFASR
jgi:hypothetical protein